MRDLEKHRFSPTERSLLIMGEVRAYFRNLKERLPKLGGVAFLGSRVIGKEKMDSDLDTVFFYDFSDEWECFSIKDRLDLIESAQYKKIYQEIIEGLGVIFQKYNIKPSGIDLLDVSQHGLDAQIKKFASVPNLDKYQDLRALDQMKGTNISNDYGWEGTFLTRLFFLTTGDVVYNARRYVLDELQKLPQGELLFQILMDHLAYLSTKAGEYPEFRSLPKTISEAKEFFLLRSNDHSMHSK